MLKQVILPIADLQKLIWNCPHCHSEMVLDLSYGDMTNFTYDSAKLACPICHVPFEPAVRMNAAKFWHAYQELITTAGTEFTFRIKLDEPAAKSTEPGYRQNSADS